MRDKGKKLAVLVLSAMCAMTQALPACASEGTKEAGRMTAGLQKTGILASREAGEQEMQVKAARAAGAVSFGQESAVSGDRKDGAGETRHSDDAKIVPDTPGAATRSENQGNALENTGEAKSSDGLRDMTGGSGIASDGPGDTAGGTGDQQDGPGNSDGSGNPDDPGNPEGPGNPDDPGNSDDPQIPAPEKPEGLRTTCQSDTKVLLEWDESDNAASYEVYRKKSGGSYKMLDTVQKTRCADKHIVYGNSYRYRIVPLNAEGVSGAAAEIAFSHRQVVNVTKQKYTYRTMKSDMEKLAKAYSNYCELTSIGTSVEGRAIYDFAIGNPDAKKSLLVVSTLHAREYVCSAMLMRQIEYYLRNYNKKIGGTKPAELLKNMQIHYIVMANPDGVTISQTTYPRWKSNSRGVDLNRNFPAKKFHVGGKKGAEGYSGKKALSEPESRAVASYTKNLKSNQGLVGVVNYHAMGQIIYEDCSSARLKSKTQKMYQIARKLTGYKSAGSNTSRGNTIGGQYREYVMYMLGLPSITLEVGATWAPCAFREYQSVFRKNKFVVLKIAEAM